MLFLLQTMDFEATQAIPLSDYEDDIDDKLPQADKKPVSIHWLNVKQNVHINVGIVCILKLLH